MAGTPSRAAMSRYFGDLVRQGRWLRFAVVSSALAWLLTMGLLALLAWLVPAAPSPRRGPVDLIVNGLILAPLLENLLVVVVLGLLRNSFSERLSVVIMTAIAVFFHAVFASWTAIAALVLFATMGLSYMSWHPSGPRLAFLILFVQHGLFNLPATAMAAYEAHEAHEAHEASETSSVSGPARCLRGSGSADEDRGARVDRPPAGDDVIRQLPADARGIESLGLHGCRHQARAND